MKNYQSLKGKKALKEVVKRGRRYYISEMELIVFKTSDDENMIKNTLIENDNNTLNIVKLGIQIKKKYGNSVMRNRIRRQIRAILSEILQKIEDDFLIIIRPRNELKSINYSDVKNIIASLLIKAGVLRPDN